MAITVKHTKVSAVPDGADTSVVRPSDWNADHTLVGVGTAAALDAGVANGVASLDSAGTVPISQLPAAVLGALSYQGTWNASTNTPTLTSNVGTKGYYYVVNVAGSTNLNGITDWKVGDWAVFNGTAWQKIDNTDSVVSVNGQTGIVVLSAADVGAVGAITSSDGSIDVVTTGSTVDIAVSAASPASTLLGQVRNETGATLTRGTVVYISGAAGNKALVSKAIATSDATSAQTYGLITADILNNQNGYATIAGSLGNLNTSAFVDGTQLYLSSTAAGEWTSTKQYAPAHLVYVGVVTRQHVNQGTIEVKIQNGYEMDELHNVSAKTPSNGNVLIWNNSTQLWVSAGITAGTGVSVTNGAGSITVANTGVTSVTGTAPVVSSGGATPAISMAAATSSVSGYLTNTDWTTFNNKLTSVTVDAPLAGFGTSGSHLSIPAATSSVSGYLTSTDWSTFNSKASYPSQTGNAGKFLNTDGTNVSWASVASSNITANGLWENANTISVNYTIGTNNNAVSSGPITIASGVTVTIPSGSVWAIV